MRFGFCHVWSTIQGGSNRFINEAVELGLCKTLTLTMIGFTFEHVRAGKHAVTCRETNSARHISE
jgi:hypothetical protein